MRTIQWFPGHMQKAMREMEAKRDLCDGVLFVLDARAPVATVNRNLKKIFGEKPVLYLFNKADLAGRETDQFLKKLESEKKYALKCNAQSQSAKSEIEKKLFEITAEKRARAKAKGQNRTFRFMVAGIPNTGKSTIVNLLGGKASAKTGNLAGVTRDVKWIKCNGFDLLDTPGTMPPAFENQTLAKHLAYIGSVNDEILDLEELSLEFLAELKTLAPETLKERYGIENETEPLKMFETLCARRGFKMRGGDFDYERGAKALFDDFRKGKLGRLTLEKFEEYKNAEF